MTIVVDIGNTRIKWARLGRGELEQMGDAVHTGCTQEALGRFAAALPEPVGAVLVANVAGPDLELQLLELLRARGAEPTVVKPAVEAYGVRCAYDDPARLGADRWVTVIAAHLLLPGAACVVDAGTTVTLDAVTTDGRHLGGVIMAGPAMVAGVLGRETRGIGHTTVADGAVSGLALLGTGTNAAVAHGAMLGIAAGLDRAVAEVASALAEPVAVVLTGGAARALEPWLKTEVSYRPHFVLEGLARIAAEQ
jgi:type III pantothenate kinase